MGLTKAEAIRQLGSRGAVSNQQALVKKIEGVQPIKPIKRIIPGGKELTSIPSEDLPMAVYTWLRACTFFTEATLSLCRSPETKPNKVTKVIDFDTRNRNPEWELRGKRWLAERIVDMLKIKNLMAVKVKKDGIYSIVDSTGEFTPSSEDWEPYIELLPFKPPTF